MLAFTVTQNLTFLWSEHCCRLPSRYQGVGNYRTASFIYYNRPFNQAFELGASASCCCSQLTYFNSFRSRNEKPNLI